MSVPDRSMFGSPWVGMVEYIYRLTLVRIRQSVRSYTLGVIWWLADPVINTVILYVVTVTLLGRRTEDTAVFLLCGLLMFRFLQTAINGACASLAPALALSTRLYVPKYAFVVRDILAEMLKFAIGIAFVAALATVLGVARFSAAETLIVTVVAVLFALGTASVVALLTALVQDTRVVIGYVFRALFFVSGTFFSLDQVPEEWRSVFLMNPFALLMHEFRLAVIYPQALDLAWLVALSLTSVAVGAVGFALLARFDRVLPKYVI